MSLLVGADDTQPSIEHGVGAKTREATTHRWVSFAFSRPDVTEPDYEHHDGPSDRFRLESIEMRRGRAPADFVRGATVVRRDHGGSQPVAGPGLLGLTLEVRRSTSDDEERALLRSWGDSPWRVALVIAMSHAPAFWAMPRSERAATYLGFHEEARAHRAKVLSRVIHRLYRTRAVEAEWDYLAYFEMQATDVAHVREFLEERRLRSNPLFTQVEREADLWMIKDLSRELGRAGS